MGHSQLVKTAIYGKDANWGRIVAAVGRSGATVRPDALVLTLCGIERFRNGQPVNDDAEDRLYELLQGNDVDIHIELGVGQGSYTLLASDLSHGYVTLNSDYRS